MHDGHSDDLVPENQSEPQFGLIDVVEAFTALRHEYRSQVTQTRDLATQLGSSVQRIEQIESGMARLAENATLNRTEIPEPSTKLNESLIDSLVEFDVQLSRAVDASIAADERRRTQRAQRIAVFEQSCSGMSRWRRWVVGSTMTSIVEQLQNELSEPTTVTDGFSILLTKVRQVLQNHRIERIETQGQSFDGETMKSIGILPAEGIPAGHVTEQLSPAYRYGGRIIRFAAVRVAP